MSSIVKEAYNGIEVDNVLYGGFYIPSTTSTFKDSIEELVSQLRLAVRKYDDPGYAYEVQEILRMNVGDLRALANQLVEQKLEWITTKLDGIPDYLLEEYLLASGRYIARSMHSESSFNFKSALDLQGKVLKEVKLNMETKELFERSFEELVKIEKEVEYLLGQLSAAQETVRQKHILRLRYAEELEASFAEYPVGEKNVVSLTRF